MFERTELKARQPSAAIASLVESTQIRKERAARQLAGFDILVATRNDVLAAMNEPDEWTPLFGNPAVADAATF